MFITILHTQNKKSIFKCIAILLSPGATVVFSLVAMALVAAVCVTVAAGVGIVLVRRRSSRVHVGESADKIALVSESSVSKDDYTA